MLVPCPSCTRHVRASEERCPFCKSAMPEAVAVVPGSAQRLTRAATYAFATLATAGLVGCGKTSLDHGGQQPAYGAPAPTTVEPSPDQPTAAVYGAPPVQDAPTPDVDAGAKASASPKAPASPSARPDGGKPK